MNVRGRLPALEPELIIKRFSPLQWTGVGPRSQGLTPLLTHPCWYVAHMEDHRKLRPQALNKKALEFWELPDRKLVKLIRKINLA